MTTVRNEEMRAINRVSKILEEISVYDRTWVFSFLRNIKDADATPKVPARIISALDGLDPAATARIVRLFTDQIAEAYARETGDQPARDNGEKPTA